MFRKDLPLTFRVAATAPPLVRIAAVLMLDSLERHIGKKGKEYLHEYRGSYGKGFMRRLFCDGAAATAAASVASGTGAVSAATAAATAAAAAATGLGMGTDDSAWRAGVSNRAANENKGLEPLCAFIQVSGVHVACNCIVGRLSPRSLVTAPI